ncbi:MAG: hypothetical protein V3R56_01985, partial [Xanthomonadales bacterium]
IRKLMAKDQLESDQFLFQSRRKASPHISTRHYAKLLKDWIEEIGLDRLVHNAYKINLKGESMRKRKTLLTAPTGSG